MEIQFSNWKQFRKNLVYKENKYFTQLTKLDNNNKHWFLFQTLYKYDMNIHVCKHRNHINTYIQGGSIK